MAIEKIDFSNNSLTIETWADKTNEIIEEINNVGNTHVEKIYAQNTYVNTLVGQETSANNILTKIKFVDGAGSGLDADLIDGKHLSDLWHVDNFDPENKADLTFVSQETSANNILTKIKSVDGAGSGLDADLIDGKHLSDLWHVDNFDPENKADLDSPTFIGTPTAPTPDPEDSSTKIATTEFVKVEAENAFPKVNFMNANLLADSGRFGGIDAKSTTVSSFVFPPYIVPYNDTTVASAGKFITNNADYGGAAGSLSATVKDLIDKIKAPTHRRYGVEFFVAELTKGAGTSSSSINVGGTLYYVSSFFEFGPQVPRQTFHMYLRAIDAPILMDRAPGMTIIKEGVAYEENVIIDPSDGWVSITVQFAFDPYEHIGYQPSAFQIRAAQSGHRYQIACPALIPGIVDIDDNIGVVAGINRYLYGLLSSTADGSLAAGYTATAVNDGTKSSGTYTPSPSGGNIRKIVNGGTFTLAAPSASGDYTMIVQVTNNSSAGAITLSGFTKSGGDAFTTTNGHDFLVFITKANGFTHAQVVALQ